MGVPEVGDRRVLSTDLRAEARSLVHRVVNTLATRLAVNFGIRRELLTPASHTYVIAMKQLPLLA
jgi:hypothetical protein